MRLKHLARIVCVGWLLTICACTTDAGLTRDELTDYWVSHSDFGLLAQGMPLAQDVGNIEVSLLAKAQPDECFSGLTPMGPPAPTNPAETPPPCNDGIPKVNQAYVWGLTIAESNLWFGTAANVHCLVLGSYLRRTNPIVTDSYVAEFGHSYYSQVLGVPPTLGDWRPPRLFMYDLATSNLVPKDTATELPPLARGRLAQTVGIRSAGAWPGSSANPQALVLLAGPRLATNGGLNVFAFDADSRELIDSTTLTNYNNIRKWLLHEGVLYTSVGNTGGGGTVLRWQSNPGTPGYPFAFEVVGRLDGAGAELTIHEGRLFVSTWPGGNEGVMAGLWMSPTIPEGGLTSAAADQWQKVWQADDYEPDPVTARTYGGGALASFDGYLYWGTMHVPALALSAHAKVYGAPVGEDEASETFLATHRAISIFRGRNFAAAPEIQLLYGSENLPVYNPLAREWALAPNKMNGQKPLFGQQGFGNPFNNYTWTMEVFDGNLYVGTMDFGYIAWEGLSDSMSGPDLAQLQLYMAMNGISINDLLGADLFRFASSQAAAMPVDRSGVGNYSTYGIRTMATDGDRLFLGMANPMNLLTDLADNKPEGGWELLALRRNRTLDNNYAGKRMSDMAVYSPGQNTWYARTASGAVVSWGTQWGFAGVTPVAGDYTGSGSVQHAVYSDTLGRWFILAGGSLIPVNWGFPGTLASPGDYTGNGRTDLGVYHPPSGQWYIRSLNGVNSWSINWGFPGAIPVPGDYDGDGRDDLAVYHPRTGNWYIRSLDGTVIAWALSWGFAAAAPVPGDYDGDGVADLAVYHEAEGKWYIRSLSGGVLAWAAQHGFKGTIPAAGDYNGDKKHDLAVYHPADGKWYIRNIAGPAIVWGENWGWNGAWPAQSQHWINRSFGF